VFYVHENGKFLIFGRPFVKRFALCYRTVVCPIRAVCPVCDVGVLWPNGWTDQDETWHAGDLGPGHIVLDWDPGSPRPKGHSPPPIFGPCLLCPNGWMDQDATWYGGRPRPGHIVLDGDPATSPPKRGHSPQFSALVCCGQTSGWIKMALGTMVGLISGNIVLDADPSPPPRGTAPKFRPMSVVVKWLDGSRCHLVRR